MPKVKRHKVRYRARKLGWQKPLSKGKPYRKTIGSAYVAQRYEYRLHATKGYRYRTLAPSRSELLEWIMARATA